MGAGHGVYHLAEGHVCGDGYEVGLYEVADLEEGEDGLVLLVRHEVSLPGEALGVEGVVLENADGAVAEGGDDEQWQEEFVAAGHLGGEEDAHQWRVHDSGHDSGHAEQGEVLAAQFHAEGEQIADVGEEIAGEGADEQRRGKGAANPSGSVGGGGGEALAEDDGADKGHQEPCRASVDVEKGAGDDGAGISRQQLVDGVVALAVQWREEEDEQGQGGAAHAELEGLGGDLAEDTFHHHHGLGEVEADESGENAQQQRVGYLGGEERL